MPPLMLKDMTDKTTPKRVLIVGDSGTGKTKFAGTAPKPFFADFDGGLATLLGHPTAQFSPYSGPEGWDALRKEIDLWRKSGPQYGAETFVLDSLTRASDCAMDAVLKKTGNTGNITIPEWGDAIRQVKEVLGKITTLPCHVIVIAHLQVEKDETTGALTWLPAIYGRELPGKIPIYFDEVWMTDVVTTLKDGKPVTQYRLQVVPDQRIKIVKSRMNRNNVFDRHETPDFSTLIEKASR